MPPLVNDRHALVVIYLGINKGRNILWHTQGLEWYRQKYIGLFNKKSPMEEADMMSYIRYEPNANGIGYKAYRVNFYDLKLNAFSRLGADMSGGLQEVE